MEDDKGLELSLGLACGRSSSKEKSGHSADATTDTDERTSKILNDFRNFLNAGVQYSPQGTDPVNPPENFFNKIQQTASGENGSVIGSGVSENKRKNNFDDINNQKKQETESRSSELQEKEKVSHISITTDEGSTGDNEDVAESEAEGSTSRLLSRHDDGSRTPGGSASSSQGPKDFHGKATIGASTYPVQTVSNSSVPYSITIKESSSVSAPSTSSYPQSGMKHSIPPTNVDHPGPDVTSTGSVPMKLRYSPVQLTDKVNPWGLVSRAQPVQSPYNGLSIPASVSMQVNNPNPSEAILPDERSLQLSKGSSSQSEENAMGQSSSFTSEYPAIRPGIAAEVKFGGSGSFPNLPWVSTTGPGPNGKTISGVTYKFNSTQIKIVCACHGTHMSPEEFVRHATETQPNTVTAPSLASLHSSNPATSAKS